MTLPSAGEVAEWSRPLCEQFNRGNVSLSRALRSDGAFRAKVCALARDSWREVALRCNPEKRALSEQLRTIEEECQLRQAPPFLPIGEDDACGAAEAETECKLLPDCVWRRRKDFFGETSWCAPVPGRVWRPTRLASALLSPRGPGGGRGEAPASVAMASRRRAKSASSKPVVGAAQPTSTSPRDVAVAFLDHGCTYVTEKARCERDRRCRWREGATPPCDVVGDEAAAETSAAAPASAAKPEHRPSAAARKGAAAGWLRAAAASAGVGLAAFGAAQLPGASHQQSLPRQQDLIKAYDAASSHEALAKERAREVGAALDGLRHAPAPLARFRQAPLRWKQQHAEDEAALASDRTREAFRDLLAAHRSADAKREGGWWSNGISAERALDWVTQRGQTRSRGSAVQRRA